MAGVWTPSAGLANPAGNVAEQFVWAALDCPGYFAVVETGQPALLGTFSVRIDQPVRAGRTHIVIGWAKGKQGRKYFSGTAVFDAEGGLLALGHAIWIAINS